MSARMPLGATGNAGCSCCHGVEVVPPLRAPLAIHARGADGYSTWFSGTFDGHCWWSPEMPADQGHWLVVGWREWEEHAPEAARPCQRRARQGGPRLFRGTGGSAAARQAASPRPAFEPRPAEQRA